MVRINLLPHREERRQQRKVAFYTMLGMFFVAALLVVLLIGAFIANTISNHNERNKIFQSENVKLDVQIAEISKLKSEVEALKARQQAVEDLQSDRNQPVYVMDELVKQIPEGVYLKSLKQDGKKIVLSGYAQSNERVSELLRNFGNTSVWLERPDLVEIRSSQGPTKEAKKIFEFTMSVDIKRLRDKSPVSVVGAGSLGSISKNP